jgi:DNA-binding Lrp family transcriptional regulator
VDGRIDYPRLAAATRWSATTVRRRLTCLRSAGILSFTVQTDARLFGHTCEAVLWLRVRPAELVAVTAALATHPEIAYAAATTGPADLVAVAVCRDQDGLYDYLTTRLGALPGILGVDTALINRYVKRAGQPGVVRAR